MTTTPRLLMPPDAPGGPPQYFGRANEAYRPDPGLISAANTALTLGLPLLLTGEPGCGKTDFAFVLARWLAERHGVSGWSPADPEHGLLECYIRSDTRARDLLYSYDALRRFGDAHHGGKEGIAHAADARHYIVLEGLGRALVSPHRRVLLIDEIDKAPRDLPNDLLRELDQREFEIPEIPPEPASEGRRDPSRLSRRMGDRTRAEALRPLIIITSNAERQLPDAFLRRCVFYHLSYPPRERLLQMLIDRFGPASPHAAIARSDDAEGIFEPAVALFTALRQNTGLIKRPATSELLIWVEAILQLASDEERWLLSVRGAELEWNDVPRLECLIKLREDLETLGVTRA